MKRPQAKNAEPSAEKTQQTAALLTPSEIFLLKGGKFATPVPEGATLLHLRKRASRTRLLETALSIALLAAERDGDINLRVRTDKRLMVRQYPLTIKFERQDRLVIEQGSAVGHWPHDSLEAEIRRALAKRSRRLFTLWTGNTVADLVGIMVNGTFWESLFFTRHAEPYLLSGMLKALVNRGIADFVPGNADLLGASPYLKGRVQLSEAGQVVMMQHDLQDVRQLLSGCKKERREIWKLLDYEVVHGLARADTASRPSGAT